MISSGRCIKTITLACFIIITACIGKRGTKLKGLAGGMPQDWPEQWNTGVIPYVFDYYSSNLKRLITTVRRGVKLMEDKGCLTFEERNPITMARQLNTTYLYYTYSGVLEECCGVYYNNIIGRRLVLITPMCRNPNEIVHATLHAMGLKHDREAGARFPYSAVNAVLFPANCVNYDIDISYVENEITDPPIDSNSSETAEKDMDVVKKRIGKAGRTLFHSYNNIQKRNKQ